MAYGHVTPPPEVGGCGYDDLQCPGGSASTEDTYFAQDWSPETALTAATTPPRSPMRIRENGSRLLPKPRDRDQAMETGLNPSPYHGHGRTASLPVNAYSMQFGSALTSRPMVDRRSASPYGQARIAPSVPAPSPEHSPAPYDHLGVGRPCMANMRSVSSSHIQSVRSHSRNISSNSIDASLLSRYGYPTYRASPIQSTAFPMSRPPSAMSHLTPIAMPGGQIQSYPNSRRTASPPANPSRLSMEAEVPGEFVTETSSVLDYLTAPNPTPSPVQRINEASKAQANHFWFDIRNLRSWSDFNINTLSSIPGLLNLLKIDISVASLPTPTKVNLDPETPTQLAEICANHHAVKVNAALKIAQGDKHIAIRSLRSAASTRQQPELIANYQSDGEKTIFGDGRGRVVGIVKSYDQWNSGYRNGSPIEKIHYLENLAHLHKHMREHGTRYGFIMTEIELVCVRAGGPPTEDNIPLYGHLEVAQSVQISASGSNADGSLKMTAGLALFYLHMLAKEQPFPGQYHWRLDVGGPTALTRRHHQPRDDWMPKVNQQDKRMSKRARGWCFPDEPLHKRECGRGRKK